MQAKVTVKFSGWMLFCPVYFESLGLAGCTPIPRCGLWFLLDLAILVQQGLNWATSLFGYDGGFMFHSVRKLSAPKLITIKE